MRLLAGVAIYSTFMCLIVLPYVLYNARQHLQSKFDEYIEKFNKTYKDDPAEYQARFHHYLESVREIHRLNTESRGPEHLRAQYGLTRMSDMSKDEYSEIHLSDEKIKKAPHLYGKSWSKFIDSSLDGSQEVTYWNFVRYTIDDEPGNSENIHHDESIITRKRRVALPLKVDWRSKGVVGPVRDQGLCGACWAFSTIGTMESMAAIRTGKLVPLSVQEAIDCAGQGNLGCSGGDICLLLHWLMSTNSTVETDQQYPLTLTNGFCRAKRNATGVRVNTFTCDNYVGAERKILEALAMHGPVAVAVNALTWQNYVGGVIRFHCSGSPVQLNHAVEIVGYNLSADIPYYIVKNSWGTDFGDNGYLYLAIGSNICGLANEMATVEVK